MTETCSHIALSKINSYFSPFTALGDITFVTDERGCLVINTPHFSNSRVVTNDIAELSDYKSFYWRGRYDNVINSGGIKIFPEEIEPRLSVVFDRPFFITSLPSDKWGQELVIVMEDSTVPEGYMKEDTIKDGLISEMKKLLPSNAVPRKVVFVTKFAKTESGKLIRKIGSDKTFF